MSRDLDTEGPVSGQQRIDVGALRHMSLCTGYGGIDIALERAFGAETVAVSDIDPGACKILAHRYPHVPNIGDMTSVDWREWAGKVDIISGGTPCQDLSSAGRRRGMTEGTRSNLWVAMRDAIATIRPQLIAWENVRGAYSAPADSDLEPCAGCVGTPGQHGPVLRALGRVLGDLAALGYDTWWYGLRASDVGAAHHRFRVFVFAVRADADDSGRGREWWLRAIERHAHRPGRANGLRGAAEPAALVAIPTPTAERDGNTPETHLARKPGRKVVTSLDVVVNHCLPSPRTSDTNGAGHHGAGGPDLRTVVSTKASEQDWREYEPAIRRQEAAFGYPAPLPTEPNKNGKPRLSAEFSSWLMGLEPGWITDTPGITRNEALKAAGNGVVPQQCEAAARRFLADYAGAP